MKGITMRDPLQVLDGWTQADWRNAEEAIDTINNTTSDTTRAARLAWALSIRIDIATAVLKFYDNAKEAK